MHWPVSPIEVTLGTHFDDSRRCVYPPGLVISPGRCSDQPGPGLGQGSAVAEDSTAPESSTTSTLVPEVPTSMPRTSSLLVEISFQYGRTIFGRWVGRDLSDPDAAGIDDEGAALILLADHALHDDRLQGDAARPSAETS